MNRQIAWILVAVVLFSAAFSRLSAEITRSNVIVEINRARLDHGLTPLTSDQRLDKAAESRLRDMEDLGYWGHMSPDGRKPFEMLRLNGFFYSNAGENLAAGFDTPRLLVLGWLESPGHRANLLSGSFTSVGVAVMDGLPTGRYDGKSVVAVFAKEFAPQPAVENPLRGRAEDSQ